MSNAIIDTAVLSGIADAIRDKTGDSAPIKLGEMADKIESISGGGGGSDFLKQIVEKTITSVSPSDLEGITTIGKYIFYNCTSLTSVTLPDAVKSVGDHAFYNCRALTSVYIPEGTPSILDYTFYYCGFSTFTIPSSVKSLGAYAFSYCTKLESITIHDSLTYIDNYAFANCTKLQHVDVGKALASVGAQSFKCGSTSNKVTYIFRGATPPTLNSTGLAVESNVVAIYVPEEAVSAYKEKTNWTTYASKIFAIPEGM